MPTEILALGMLRALIEVAGLMLILRGVLWVFGPKARQGNFVYDILTIGAMPFVKLTRAVTPRVVPNTGIPVVAFLLLFAIWTGLGLAQHALCEARSVQCV